MHHGPSLYAEALAIAKFKIHQYMTVLPNLMHAKVSCYTVQDTLHDINCSAETMHNCLMKNQGPPTSIFGEELSTSLILVKNQAPLTSIFCEEPSTSKN